MGCRALDLLLLHLCAERHATGLHLSDGLRIALKDCLRVYLSHSSICRLAGFPRSAQRAPWRSCGGACG